jgi:hypothetical protein
MYGGEGCRGKRKVVCYPAGGADTRRCCPRPPPPADYPRVGGWERDLNDCRELAGCSTFSTLSEKLLMKIFFLSGSLMCSLPANKVLGRDFIVESGRDVTLSKRSERLQGAGRLTRSPPPPPRIATDAVPRFCHVGRPRGPHLTYLNRQLKLIKLLLICLRSLTAPCICLFIYLSLPGLELLSFAGCGDIVPGAAEGEGGSGSGSGPGTGMDLGRNVIGVVVEDRRTENELLDCSMESTGEDPTRSPGGAGESILDESGEESEGSMDTGEKATMDAAQEDGGVYSTLESLLGWTTGRRMSS